MWNKYHPGHDRFTSSLEQLSLRLNDLIKRTSLSIVVASHNTPNSGTHSKTPWSTTNQTILNGLHDHTGDNLVSWDRDEVMKFLNLHKVQDLYFAGVSFPGCIQHRHPIQNVASPTTAERIERCSRRSCRFCRRYCNFRYSRASKRLPLGASLCSIRRKLINQATPDSATRIQPAGATASST